MMVQLSDSPGRVRGRVEIWLGPIADDRDSRDGERDGEVGEWALAAAADNLFVNLGYQQIAKFLAGLVDAPRPTHLAVGTAANPVIAAADTALGTELSRKALASGGVIANYTVRLAAFWLAAEAQGTLTEVGLFSAASGGFLFARSAVTCVKGNQPMNVVWQFQLPTAG